MTRSRKVLNVLAYVAGGVLFLLAKLVGYELPEDEPSADEPVFADDGLLRVPIRLAPEVAHGMIEGWLPVGFGATHLNPNPDGSFDLMYCEADLSQQHNLIKLDNVDQALMAALDLARSVQDDEYEVSAEVAEAAREVERLVRRAGN